MREELPGAGGAWRLGLFFLAAGGLALSVQVALLRDLLVALQGDESAVALGLACWLAGITAGALAARRWSGSRPRLWAGCGLSLLALWGPLGVVLARAGRFVLAPPPGELLSLGPGVALAAASLAPAGALVGATFTVLAAVAHRAGWGAGRGIASLYVLESMGSLAAGLGMTFLVIPSLRPIEGLCFVGAFWLLVAFPAAQARRVNGRVALPVLAFLLALAALPPLAGPIEQSTVALRFRGLAPGMPLLDWEETPYQHVALGGDRELRHLYMGGQYAGSFPDPAEDEARAHRLASLAPNPGRVLLLGSGALGALRHLLAHPVESIELVEMDRRALALVSRYLAREDRRALEDPRVRVVTDDPRRILASKGEDYGLILVLEPDPVTLLLARLSTVQFYRLCAGRLAPDGALVVGMQTAPNVLAGERASLAGSVYGALREVFPAVYAAPGPDGLLLAGTDQESISLDPAVLARRFEERGIASKVFDARLFPLLFPPARIAAQSMALEEAARGVPASRDERPVSFLHALALRQRVAGSAAAPLLRVAAHASPAVLGLVALLPSLVVVALIAAGRDRGRGRALATTHAVAATGACGMIWSLLVLFSYQTRAGALYGRLGWLTASFMLGLALGGRAVSRAASAPASATRRWLLAVLGVALLFAAAMPAALTGLGQLSPRGAGVLEIGHGSLLLLAGAVTGSLFPAGVGSLLSAGRGARGAAGGLEAADHAGAALAALAGGILLVPALGLAGTAWLTVGLVALALTGVILAVESEPDPSA